MPSPQETKANGPASRLLPSPWGACVAQARTCRAQRFHSPPRFPCLSEPHSWASTTSRKAPLPHACRQVHARTARKARRAKSENQSKDGERRGAPSLPAPSPPPAPHVRTHSPSELVPELIDAAYVHNRESWKGPWQGSPLPPPSSTVPGTQLPPILLPFAASAHPSHHNQLFSGRPQEPSP